MSSNGLPLHLQFRWALLYTGHNFQLSHFVPVQSGLELHCRMICRQTYSGRWGDESRRWWCWKSISISNDLRYQTYNQVCELTGKKTTKFPKTATLRPIIICTGAVNRIHNDRFCGVQHNLPAVSAGNGNMHFQTAWKSRSQTGVVVHAIWNVHWQPVSASLPPRIHGIATDLHLFVALP